ncbi:hypothetical protein ACH5RR_039233 [Cinchona calisaya]|uniref:Uncharacterized protein n=1 Tax=Cinchona calisaya TaxID=153742 RepID=A0ABD2Y2W8_9GENT
MEEGGGIGKDEEKGGTDLPEIVGPAGGWPISLNSMTNLDGAIVEGRTWLGKATIKYLGKCGAQRKLFPSGFRMLVQNYEVVQSHCEML